MWYIRPPKSTWQLTYLCKGLDAPTIAHPHLLEGIPVVIHEAVMEDEKVVRLDAVIKIMMHNLIGIQILLGDLAIKPSALHGVLSMMDFLKVVHFQGRLRMDLEHLHLRSKQAITINLTRAKRHIILLTLIRRDLTLEKILMQSMTRLLVQLSVSVRIEWKRKEGEEVGQSDTEEGLLEAKAYAAPNGILHSVERRSLQEISSSYTLENRSSDTLILKKNDQIANLSVRSDTSNRILGMEDHFNQRATLLEAHEALDEPGIIEHSTQHSGSKFA